MVLLGTQCMCLMPGGDAHICICSSVYIYIYEMSLSNGPAFQMYVYVSEYIPYVSVLLLGSEA